MKIVLALVVILFIGNAKAQKDAFHYSIDLSPVSISNLPGLHSYAFGQSDGIWLVIGGRKDGIHARQPFNAFPKESNNTDILVIDPVGKKFWSTTINILPQNVKEQMQSTNMNFFQDADSLYIVGGYAYSETADDFITFPNLTSVSVSGVINAVINGESIHSHFKQITNTIFSVTGGHLAKIGKTFYLVGGQKFDGQYNPMGNPTYTQTYVDGLRKFSIDNSGSQLSYSNYAMVFDPVHLHRRDYNLLPQIFPDGTEGYTVSSGVFQTGVNLPFLYPVNINSNSHTSVTSFNQYLSNYHSATACLFDSVNNQMHSLFFGGISQYYYQNGKLIKDDNVPFVKTISRVSRFQDNTLQEFALPVEMPALVGASSEFIYNEKLPHYPSGIIKLSEIPDDSMLIGYIFGGISSTQLNPFASNNTNVTIASNVVYQVWLRKDANSSIRSIDGSNPFLARLFPNPNSDMLSAEFVIPYNGNIYLTITDISGHIIKVKQFNHIDVKKPIIEIVKKDELQTGVYFFHWVFDDKYAYDNKVVFTQ